MLSGVRGGGGLHEGQLVLIPFRSLLRQAMVTSFSMRRAVQSLLLSIQHFLCQSRRPPLPCKTHIPFEDALKDDSGEAVVARDKPEPREFPSLESCHESFPWTHKSLISLSVK